MVLVVGLVSSSAMKAQSVNLTATQDHNIWGIPSTSYTFDIEANNIPTREVQVNAYELINSSGAVVLTTGGTGTSFYSQTYGAEAKKLIDSLYTNGFEVYEVKWNDPKGWATYCEGIGYHIAVGGYSVLVEHLFQNYFDNNALVFATGNSGGSIQIAYGLALYGLENIFDMVVLTGGPPISNLKAAIFGDRTEPESWPDGLFGFKLTDYMMGWANQQYCEQRVAPDSIKNALDTVSIFSRARYRDYDYLTVVNFVESNDPTHADHQAKIYYDTITSEKGWYYLSDVDIHAVPTSAEGSAKIRDLMLEYTATGYEEKHKKDKCSIFPNPTKRYIQVNCSTPLNHVQIVNTSGSIVMQTSYHNYSSIVNLSDIERGMYLVLLTDKENRIIEKRKLIVE